MTTFGLEPVFGSYWLVLIAIGGLLAALTISPAFASTSLRRSRTLLGLRLGVIFLLAMGMLRPTLIRTGLREEQSTIAILLDASRSMSVADVQDKSRWESALKTLEVALRDRNSSTGVAVPIQPFVFSETVRSVPPRGQSWDFPASPAGNQTDLGAALDGTLRAHATSALAAVIVLSDGAQRTVHPSVPLTQPAHELGRRGVPLITIPFGRTREQSQSRDISVEVMPDAFESFVKNEVVVRAILRQQGFAKHPIPAQLVVESPDGQKEVIGPVIAQSQTDLEQLTVEFSVTPQIPGEYRLTLEVPPQPGEQLTDNNKLQAFLDVLEGGLRVLYLDGNVGWQEQRYIRRALDGAAEIDLDYTWIDPRQKSAWPVDIPAAFADHPYDVLLMSDVHARAIGPQHGAFLAERINSGMGFMMLGGAKSFGGGGYGKNPLGAVLPLRLSSADERNLDAQPDETLHIMKDILMSVEVPHFITRLDKLRDRWSELPALQGANRLLPNGVAEVLLKGDSNEPLLIAGQSGLGRTLAFAGDSTYRWYRRGKEELHQRFWRQAILWLAKKDTATDEAVWLKLQRRRILLGGQIDFETCFHSTTIPSTEVTFGAFLITPGGNQLPLALPAASADGLRASTGALMKEGEYRLRVVAQHAGKELDQAELGFWVIKQDLELADSAANPEQLAYLSSLTAAAGGVMIVPEQLGKTLDQIIKKRQDHRVEVKTRWQLTDTPYDAWLLFGCMLALLSYEWYLRRRWSMV